MNETPTRRSPGELAIVLHTHMPYVEGFGTWPFGEEWLWEAIATSYLPLLDLVLDPAHPSPVTLSLTPVLCDQLGAPGAIERCVRFLSDVRPASHALDIEDLRGEDALVSELRRSEAEYAAAAERLAGLSKGLLSAFGAHASWTSSATHAVLPLIATDAGVDLQVQTGIASHRRRFGDWKGGFWLPECGYAPWLNPLLEESGVRSTCVELTSVFGLGDPRNLRPLATDDGPVLWPIDRQTMDLVWSDEGYPAAGVYRNYHGLTPRHHRVWANDGGPYRFDRAVAQAADDARDFVRRVRDRVAAGGVCICALDTELLGHWWFEGVHWLAGVIEEAARQRLPLTTLEDALARHEPAEAPESLGVTSWGTGGDLRTWSSPAVADMAWLARSAELKVLGLGRRPNDRALRELLALQSSDWAFLAFRGTAGDYPRERAARHAELLGAALAEDPELDQALANLAPELVGWTQ